MTVAAKPAVAEYLEDGVSTAFPVPFRFKSASDLVVARILDGVVIPLVLGVDYAVVGGATDAGGTLTRTASTTGGVIQIARRTVRAQPMVYTTGDRFPAVSHEEALDRGILIAQEQDAKLDEVTSRALLLPPGEAAVVLPPRAMRLAGLKKVLTVDQASGDVVLEPIDTTYRGASGLAANTRGSRAELKAAKLTDGTSLFDGALYTYDPDALPGDGFGRVAPDAGTSGWFGSGAWVRSLTGDERSVSTLTYDAICDGNSHPLSERFSTLLAARMIYPTAQSLADEIDLVAFEAAVAKCRQSENWATLILPGPHVFNRPAKIDRPFDRNNLCDLRIVGRGRDAGIVGGGDMAFIDTDLAATNGVDGPVSEGIHFQGLTFRGRGFFDMANVVTGKFFRITAEGCRFFLCRLVKSETHYLQSYRVVHCDILNGSGHLLRGAGAYNINVVACRAFAGMGILSITNSPRGANNVSITDGLMEFAVSRMLDITGVNGLFVAGNYTERGQPANFNLFAGTQPNVSSTFIGNIVLRPLGTTVQHNGGLTQSIGTVVAYDGADPHFVLHGNANALDEGVSIGDRNVGGIHDATYSSRTAGVTRFGGVADTWQHSHNHFTKSAAGAFGFGMPANDGIRHAVRGFGQTVATAAGRWYDGQGNEIASFTDDRGFRLPALPEGAGVAANRALVRADDGSVRTLAKVPAPAGSDSAKIAAIIAALTNAGIFA